MTTGHIRTQFRRRYSMNSIGSMTRVRDWEAEAKTVCGAPVTAYDFGWGDVKKATKKRYDWDVCSTCLRAFERVEENGDSR